MTTKNPVTRWAAGALVGGITTLALAAPASAAFPKDPELGGGSVSASSTPAAPVDAGWEMSQVMTGAVAGLVLAGAGVAAAAGMRRHHHLAHPA